jgi:rifampin ADP-ribosylating transferase
METNSNKDNSIETPSGTNALTFYHGTRADLKQGDLIGPGYNSIMVRGKRQLMFI